MYRETTHNGKYRYIQSFKDLDGKNRRVSVVKENKTRATEKQAYEELQEKIKAILNPVQKVHNLGYYKEKYLEFKKTTLGHHTYLHYERSLRILEDEEKLENLTKLKIEKRFNEIRNDFSPHTLKTRGVIYNNFFEFIKKYYVPWFDLKIEFKLTKEERARDIQKIKYLEKDEIPTLLSKIKNPRARNIAIIQLNTGLRIGEVLALTPNDVDFADKTISITKTKTPTGELTAPKTISSIRTIEVSDAILNILRDFISCKKFIFNVKYSAVQQTFKKVNVTSHMFRHTHVALLIESGVPIKVISQRLGHSDIKTTLSIYTHVTKNMKVDLQKKLETLSLFFPYK